MALAEVVVMAQVEQRPGVQEATTTSTGTARDMSGAVERVQRPQTPEPLRSESSDAPARLGMTRNLGWYLAVASAVGALLSSWALFPMDSVGMWAGYWVSGCTTMAILGAMMLRTSLTKALGVAITAMPGGLLLLFGALRDYPTTIKVTLIVGGAGIVIGALTQIDRPGGAES